MRRNYIKTVFYVSLFFSNFVPCFGDERSLINYLEHRGSFLNVKEESNSQLRIFCYRGVEASIFQFWTSTTMKLKIDSEDYRIFLGENSSRVQELYEESEAAWFYSHLPWKSKELKVDPFHESCLGVSTAQSYSLVLNIYRINYWQVLMTVFGFLIFHLSPKLCRNVFFHYTTGIAAGIFFSLLVLTYFIQRRVRASWYSWILGCYSLAIYFLTSIWYNLQSYILEHHTFVLTYFILCGLISFGVCYRMGPVENPRSLNLIQWSLQGFALTLIYLSSYYQLASLSLGLLLLSWSSLPDSFKASLKTQYRRKFFKPKITLLSEAEYMDQAKEETEKALSSLRNYCRSPECKVWKTVGRLSSPARFSEFIEGSSHLTSEEVINYSQTVFDDTLDSLENDDDDNEDENDAMITDDEAPSEMEGFRDY